MTPRPLESTAMLDVFGNAALQISFTGLHGELSIEASSRTETLRNNPFDYLLLDSQFRKLPAAYDPRSKEALSPHLKREENDPRIDKWAKEVATFTQSDTQAFLLRLSSDIYRDYQSETRHSGAPYAPSETFDRKQGSCRDLAVLFMDACRSQDIACRFVSGYIYEPSRADSADLHAWSEVYLPGGGWRGYDPSRGVAVADRHIPIAVGPTADWAAPTEGCYISGDSDSKMSYEVNILEGFALN